MARRPIKVARRKLARQSYVLQEACRLWCQQLCHVREQSFTVVVDSLCSIFPYRGPIGHQRTYEETKKDDAAWPLLRSIHHRLLVAVGKKVRYALDVDCGSG